MLVLMLLLSCAFLAFPKIDLIVSGWFYTPAMGFFLKDDALFVFLYEAVPIITHLFEIIFLAILLLSFTHSLQRYLIPLRKPTIYLSLALLLGPGLLVNGVLKNHWDRARPYQVTQFGGNKIFSAAWMPSNQCDHNCSFTSGHASIGFYFLSFGYLFPRQRRLWLGIGIGLGELIGLARIAQGGHFLSDIVFSFFIIYFTAQVIANLLLKGQMKEGIFYKNLIKIILGTGS